MHAPEAPVTNGLRFCHDSMTLYEAMEDKTADHLVLYLDVSLELLQLDDLGSEHIEMPIHNEEMWTKAAPRSFRRREVTVRVVGMVGRAADMCELTELVRQGRA